MPVSVLLEDVSTQILPQDALNLTNATTIFVTKLTAVVRQ